MRLKPTLFAIAVTALLASSSAHAAVQTRGEEQLGKVWIGVHPIGGSAFFNDYQTGIYKFGFDVLGRIADAGKLTLWLGGELNIGGVANYALIEPGIIFQMTFEKMLHIPLVPHVRVGFSGGIDNYYGGGTCYTPNGDPFVCDRSDVAGDFWFKFGGGVHYFLTRNIGLGIETNFALGAHIWDAGNETRSGFRGYVDFLTGAVFTF
jgi:hypothetical protein